jgi:hypothetical protein
MSNKTASVSISASYSDPDDARAALARANIDCPYTAQSHNEIDIPDTTVSDTEYAVDFGSIGTEATFLKIVNNTANGENPGQDLWVKLQMQNVYSHKHYLPPGGCFVIANPKATGAYPLVAASVTTTATQNGPGRVSTHVFGDPT